MKLQKMTDFVITANEKIDAVLECNEAILKYAEFLKQPLKMSMFIPMDSKGNILEPDAVLYGGPTGWGEIYKTALEKVLFKGFEVKDYYAEYTGEDEMIYIDEEFCEDMTIESFLNTIISELELTESALKQIGIDE